MYKDLKKWLEDKKILEEDIKGLNERIKYKIQKELGLHSTTFKEVKIETLNIVDDRFLRVFEKIEKLDKRREMLQGELDIINDVLNNIDTLIKGMTDIKKEVFRCRFILGLTVEETAKRLGYSSKQIKRITKEMFENSKMSPQCPL